MNRRHETWTCRPGAIRTAALAVILAATPAAAGIEAYTAVLDGEQAVPPTRSTATGTATIQVDTATLVAVWTVAFEGLTPPQTGAHLHNGPAGEIGPILFSLPLGSPVDGTWVLTPDEYAELAAGRIYLNLHTGPYFAGEIRGQLEFDATAADAVTLGEVKARYR